MARIALGSRKEAAEPAFVCAVAAEFILTFIFVFVGVGTVMTTGEVMTTATAHQGYIVGLTAAASQVMIIPVMIAVGIDLDAGHLNPAVTITFAVGGLITVVRSICYVTVQLLASWMACLLLKYLTGGLEIPVQAPAAGTGALQGAAMEAILTFSLVMSIYAVIVNPTKGVASGMGPVLIGLVAGANTLAGGRFSGASMNPARSFGPALAAWDWTDHWVYWTGPIAGGCVAGFVYDRLFAFRTGDRLPARDEECG